MASNSEPQAPGDELTRAGMTQRLDHLSRRITAYETNSPAALRIAGAIVPDAMAPADRQIIEAQIADLKAKIEVSKTVPAEHEPRRRKGMRKRLGVLEKRLARSAGAVAPGLEGLEQLKAQHAEMQALFNDFDRRVKPLWAARESWLRGEVDRLYGAIRDCSAELLAALEAEAPTVVLSEKYCALWDELMTKDQERRHCGRELSGSMAVREQPIIPSWPWGGRMPSEILRDGREAAGQIYYHYINNGPWSVRDVGTGTKPSGSGQQTRYGGRTDDTPPRGRRVVDSYNRPA